MEIPADQQWGTVQKDGSVSGMVGEVAARRAHLAIDEFTITGRYILGETKWQVEQQQL